MMDRRLAIVLVLALAIVASVAAVAENSKATKPRIPDWEWVTICTGQTLNPSSSNTPTTKLWVVPAPGGSKVVQYNITDTSGGATASVALYVVGTVDGTNWVYPSANAGLTTVGPTRTGIIAIGSPGKECPGVGLELRNLSATVTASCTVTMGGN